MLVDIPSTYYIEGISVAPGISGVRQRIDARALPNLLAFARAFHAAGYGALRTNEGSRTRPRQLWMWQNRVKLGVTVAVPYTSNHDEVQHGNAVDFGSNINIFGSPQQRWAAANGPRFGVRPTGLNFATREPWHYDIDMVATSSGGTTIPVQEDDMYDDNDRKRDNTIAIQMQAVHDAIFTTSPTSRGSLGVLAELKKLDDALFKTDPTSFGTPGGVLKTLRTVTDKLGITKP